MITRNLTFTRTAPLENQDIARFIECANSYKSSLVLTTEQGRINAKSLLGVIALHLCNGMELVLTADGPDEAQAIDALVSRLSA